MGLNDYKEVIKRLIDLTGNELLLKHWKEQLEWDVEHQGEFNLSAEESQLVEEGLQDYEKGAVLSLEEFISKRK